MDPAFAITSPFRNEVKAVDGVLDQAIADVTSSDLPTRWAGASDPTDVMPPTADVDDACEQTPCLFCSSHATRAIVPSDGMYICTACVAHQQATQTATRSFPPGTFACCPTATDERNGGVVRCAACDCWYHCPCVGLQSGPLQGYATLSTTQWYCPKESCCGKVLQAHLRSKR